MQVFAAFIPHTAAVRFIAVYTLKRPTRGGRQIKGRGNAEKRKISTAEADVKFREQLSTAYGTLLMNLCTWESGTWLRAGRIFAYSFLNTSENKFKMV